MGISRSKVLVYRLLYEKNPSIESIILLLLIKIKIRREINYLFLILAPKKIQILTDGLMA